MTKSIEQVSTKLDSEQQRALIALRFALSQATQCGLFDEFAAHSHPDRINSFCDDLKAFASAEGIDAHEGSSLRDVSSDTGQPQQCIVDRGMLLRSKALALLQEAQVVDGLKPFTVTHTHSFGESTYVLWAAETPSQEEAEAVLDSEFEPDREETLVVEDCISLDEMSGVAVTARLRDILQSRQSPSQDDSPSP